MATNLLRVEVVFALPDKATSLTINVPEGTTVYDAVISSKIADQCTEIDLANLSLGVWNRTCKQDKLVSDGDRIEIYRPLIADPKESRRRRAEKAKEEGRANKITGGRALKK